MDIEKHPELVNWICDTCHKASVGAYPSNIQGESQTPTLFGTSLADCNDIEKLRAIAEKLWSILDDIDTASDMFKPSDEDGYRRFYEYTMKKAEDRGKQLESDGYHLYLPNNLSHTEYRLLLWAESQAQELLGAHVGGPNEAEHRRRLADLRAVLNKIKTNRK